MGIPRCGACDELIFSDEFVKAESQTWHTEHFACWLCDARLAGSEYVMLALGQPACVSCWSASNRRTCAACGHDIRCFIKSVSLPLRPPRHKTWVFLTPPPHFIAHVINN